MSDRNALRGRERTKISFIWMWEVFSYRVWNYCLFTHTMSKSKQRDLKDPLCLERIWALQISKRFFFYRTKINQYRTGKFSVKEILWKYCLFTNTPFRANSVYWMILCGWREFKLYKSRKDFFSFSRTKSMSIQPGLSVGRDRYLDRKVLISLVTLRVPDQLNTPLQLKSVTNKHRT